MDQHAQFYDRTSFTPLLGMVASASGALISYIDEVEPLLRVACSLVALACGIVTLANQVRAWRLRRKKA